MCETKQVKKGRVGEMFCHPIATLIPASWLRLERAKTREGARTKSEKCRTYKRRSWQDARLIPNYQVELNVRTMAKGDPIEHDERASMSRILLEHVP